ncbi:hypothetical protein [Aquamicrobium sp.]|uniref:hypothetical protein n=1 Tax=Aquamicrobium sp. TaxID=1872579 RepID=UPI0025868DCA|nr:hypothetical protein [Aquamicrobium sp.]MCK9550264.1 hypothetical protein [Aquamicrobium sp.]
MTDYMKEAERLLEQYDDACLGIIGMSEEQARADLLAHIQRGVPEGYVAVPRFLAENHRNLTDVPRYQRILDDCLAAAPDQFRDAAKMAPVHCTPTEHDGRIVYEHTSEPIPNADGFVLYPPVSDQFRAAAKMMAVQPACMNCSGHGMVGGLLPSGGGYQADPAEVPMPKPVAYGFGNTAITGHTNRLMMVRIDIPGGDQYAGAFWLPLVLADEAHTYGVACRAAGEAAGYVRGLRDAVRDAAPLVQNGEVLVTVTGLTGSGKSAIAGEIEIMCRALGLEVEWGEGAAEKHLTHADWTNALEMYRPRVRIVEANISRTDAALAKWKESK